MRSGKTTGFQHCELSLLFEASLLTLHRQAVKLLQDLNRMQHMGWWTGLLFRIWLRASFYSLVTKQHKTILLSEDMLSGSASAELSSIADIHLQKVLDTLSSVIVVSEFADSALWHVPVEATRYYLVLLKGASESLGKLSVQSQVEAEAVRVLSV